MKQTMYTVERAVTVTGIGLHTGAEVKTEIRPRERGGIVFVREDLPGSPPVRACIANHVSELRRTVIRKQEAEIHTPEHLLATLYVLEIRNAEIGVWGSELPGLDGSARVWAEEILSGGLVPVEQEEPRLQLREAVSVCRGSSAIAMVPHDRALTITYHLDHDNPIIPVQNISFECCRETFLHDIAPARTFVLEDEVKQLRAVGLGKGATVKNTLVVTENGVRENTLRFEDEFARHKLLDFLGDLALLETRLEAHAACLRSGHELNTLMVKKLRNITEKEG